MDYKFNENLKERILKLAEEGKTIKEIAYFLGICERSIYNWLGKYKDFKEALQKSKSVANEIVEATLFQRAIGYTHKETKVFFDSQSLSTVEHKVDKHHPPDITAAKFWLINRDPDRWKEKQEIKHEGDISIAEKLRKARERTKAK